MSTKFKKLTSMCLAVIMILGVLTVAPFSAGAAETDSDSVDDIYYTSGDFEYDVSYDETATIIRYNGDAAELDIPSTLDGYTVTDIGSCAFESCTRLVSVTIPDKVTYIWGYAFVGCTSLESVTIPDGVTYIGDYAFENCSSLASVTIPYSVDYIGEYAFGYNCDEYYWDYTKIDGFKIYGYTNSAAEVYAKDNGFDFVSIGEAPLFRYEILDDGTAGVTAYYGKETDLIIPSTFDAYTITEIGWGAFKNCTSLVGIMISESVTSIGDYAFAGCTSLESVTIPDDVTYIGDCAFESCTSLSSVTIPYSVDYIGEYAFGYNCDEDYWDYTKIDGFKIYGYTNSAAEVYAKDNGFDFVSIGEAPPFRYEILDDGTAGVTAYYGKETDLIIPSTFDAYTVTQIGLCAFKNCTSLAGIMIPESVTFIGGYAFAGCTSLESVTIPDGVTVIGDNAFVGCTSLESVTIPDGVTVIGDYAFESCSSLASVTIPYNVDYIGEYAFGYNYDEDYWEYTKIDGFKIYGYINSAAEVYAKDNGFDFVSIGEAPLFRYEILVGGTARVTAYYGKETDLIIPSTFDAYTVTQIGWYAFKNCTSLADIIIPESVTSIGDYAFAGCTSLESVTIPDGVTYIGGSVFENCTSLTSVTIPGDVDCIGEYAFGYTCDEYEWEYIKIDGFKIYGYTGSEAEKYASENGFTFISIGDAPTPKLGDVNGDGNVSIDDVTDIQKYIADMISFTDEQKKLADVDKDDWITIDDVTLIQKYLAGMAEI